MAFGTPSRFLTMTSRLPRRSSRTLGAVSLPLMLDLRIGAAGVVPVTDTSRKRLLIGPE